MDTGEDSVYIMVVKEAWTGTRRTSRRSVTEQRICAVLRSRGEHVCPSVAERGLRPGGSGHSVPTEQRGLLLLRALLGCSAPQSVEGCAQGCPFRKDTVGREEVQGNFLEKELGRLFLNQAAENNREVETSLPPVYFENPTEQRSLVKSHSSHWKPLFPVTWAPRHVLPVPTGSQVPGYSFSPPLLT